MLSLTCKAAIKAVVYLGSIYETNEKAGIKEIAGYISENEHTVGKLLQKLVKAGVIGSSKGPNGGFFITAKQRKQPIINIVHAIDGEEIFKQCGLGLSKCSDVRPCPFHNDFKPIREQYKKLCTEKLVSDLYEDINKRVAYLTG